jgi:SAM-dependent methyltransferase
MHLDVTELRDFHYRSALGRAARRVLRDEVLRLWPEAKGQTVAGFGFAVPLLRPYLADARRVMALMPGPQGVMPWPHGQANVALLCEETLWPLSTGFVDKLIVMHGLEVSEQPAALLEECWRVLGPGGRAIFVVPNRAGIWSRTDATPFGFGRPYTMGQLETVLRRHRFVIERGISTLYQPPSVQKLWRKVGSVMESAGRHLPLLAAGGILVVEVAKQVAQPTRGATVAERRRPIPVGLPMPATRGAAQPRVQVASARGSWSVSGRDGS